MFHNSGAPNYYFYKYIMYPIYNFASSNVYSYHIIQLLKWITFISCEFLVIYKLDLMLSNFGIQDFKFDKS